MDKNDFRQMHVLSVVLAGSEQSIRSPITSWSMGS